MDTPTDPAEADRKPASVEVYWRPGCGFCMRLERQLERIGLPTVRHDIWEDPTAAEVVRSVANGSETVPTVIIGDQAMVNPSAALVLTVVAEAAPELLPEGIDPENLPAGPVTRTVNRLLGRD